MDCNHYMTVGSDYMAADGYAGELMTLLYSRLYSRLHGCTAGLKERQTRPVRTLADYIRMLTNLRTPFGVPKQDDSCELSAILQLAGKTVKAARTTAG